MRDVSPVAPNAPIPLAVRACIAYNRLFRFRARFDPVFEECRRIDREHKRDPIAAGLAYAEYEYNKTAALLGRFGEVPLAGRRVLDFGCGFGGSTAWYADQGAARVIGVDVVEAALEVARRYAGARTAGGPGVAGIEFRLGGARTIPVEDGAIDLIITEDVVEHIEDPEAVFREWHRVLVPGGRVLISFGPLWYHPHGVHLWEVFPGPWNHLIFSERTWMMARNILKADGGRSLECTSINKMGLGRFERLVRGSGFRVRSLRPQPLRGLRPLLSVPVLRELFASQVICDLEK